MSEPIKILHIHAQAYWHGDAWIVGNREALERLRELIYAALLGVIIKADFFTNDGEGYSVHIVPVEGQIDTPAIASLAVPYIDPDAEEKRGDAVWPWKMK